MQSGSKDFFGGEGEMMLLYITYELTSYCYLII